MLTDKIKVFYHEMKLPYCMCWPFWLYFANLACYYLSYQCDKLRGVYLEDLILNNRLMWKCTCSVPPIARAALHRFETALLLYVKRKDKQKKSVKNRKGALGLQRYWTICATWCNVSLKELRLHVLLYWLWKTTLRLDCGIQRPRPICWHLIRDFYRDQKKVYI